MKPPRARLLLVGAAATTVAVGSTQCSDADAPVAPARDAGAADTGVDEPAQLHDVGGNGGGGGAEAGPCPEPARPAVVPDGWTPWMGWSCKCPMWIPGPQAAPVPPIEWEPCGANAPAGLDCRQMKITWAHSGHTAIGIPAAKLGHDKSGKPVLLITRMADADPVAPYMEELATELDGPVRFIMRRVQKWNGPCAVGFDSLMDDRIVYTVAGDGSTPTYADSNVDGMLHLTVGQSVPEVGQLKNADAEVWGWYGGHDRIVHGISPSSTWHVYDTDFAHLAQLWPPVEGDPDGLPMVGTSMNIVGKAVIFEVGTLYLQGEMAYDDALGVHPLIRFYGDATQGAGNLGTDGKDMVWTYGEGKLPAETKYPTLSVMTAPFTTDPMALTPKRLRSDPSWDMANRFVVGHGYAGHDAVPPATKLIVRLSDGASWILPKTDSWESLQVLGFTEDEVLLSAATPDNNVVRVRLDSLGPATPPD